MFTIEDFKSPQEAVDKINSLAAQLSTAINEKNDAEAAAESAIAQAEAALESAPKSFVTTVDGVGKVKVNFGVDGLSKDELLKDSDKIAKLVKINSHAVTVLEAEEA